MNLYYILAAACALYFFGLILYGGTLSGFYFFWLFAGACFLLLALAKSSPDVGFLLRAHDLVKARAEGVPLWCKRTVFVLFIVGMCIFCAVEALIIRQCSAKGRDGLDYIIVLGAGVRPGGRPSNALKKRLEKAYEYKKQNPGTLIVVSGGKGADEPVSEAECMRDYLTARGIDGDSIIMEDKSRNTSQNLHFSYRLIPENASVGVVSNNFHIFRALYIARSVGFTDVCGIAARGDIPTALNSFVREFFGVLKDVLTTKLQQNS